MERLFVLKTNCGLGVSELIGTETRLLGVLYLAIAGESAKDGEGAADDDEEEEAPARGVVFCVKLAEKLDAGG